MLDSRPGRGHTGPIRIEVRGDRGHILGVGVEHGHAARTHRPVLVGPEIRRLQIPVGDHGSRIGRAGVDDNALLVSVVELRSAQLDLNSLGLELLLHDDLLGVALWWIRLAHELARDGYAHRDPSLDRPCEGVDERSEVAVDAVDGDVHGCARRLDEVDDGLDAGVRLDVGQRGALGRRDRGVRWRTVGGRGHLDRAGWSCLPA